MSSPGPVDIQTKKPWYDFNKNSWGKGRQVQLFCLSYKGGIELCCSKICSKENDIFTKEKLGKGLYTLLFGPQTYENNVLTIRIGLIKGLWRSGIDYIKPTPPVVRKLPKGVVIEYR